VAIMIGFGYLEVINYLLTNNLLMLLIKHIIFNNVYSINAYFINNALGISLKFQYLKLTKKPSI